MQRALHSSDIGYTDIRGVCSNCYFSIEIIKCCGVLLFLSATDSVENLMLKTNQTADSICLGDDYYLFCVSQEPFGSMCSVTTPSWYNNRTGRIDTTSNTKYNESTANATVAVLKFRITEEFNEPQTFYCAAATTCMSNEVLVRRYGEYKTGTHV